METSGFSHATEYSLPRRIIGLHSADLAGVYEPSSALVLISQRGARSHHYEAVLHHEFYHALQFASTSVGIVLLSLYAMRSAIFESYVRKINEDFDSGLWVPISGWMDDLDNSPEDFYNPRKPYYYVSSLKRDIGIVDSLLLALGAFESMNQTNCTYWHTRFPWVDILPDKSWEYTFMPQWWPNGSAALLEATTVYLEILHTCGSIKAANKELHARIQKERVRTNQNLPSSPNFRYYNPFLLCEEIPASPPPYHLTPITAFWALNGPIPHLHLSKEISGRDNSWRCPWIEMDPRNLYHNLLFEIADDLGIDQDAQSLLELAASWKPVFTAMDEKRIVVEEIVATDIEYVNKVQQYGKQIGRSLDLAFHAVKFPQSLEERLTTFFSYPPDQSQLARIAVASKNAPPPGKPHLEAFLLSQLAYHLIPNSSFRSLPRLRLGEKFLCPSRDTALSNLCPARNICDGHFPDTVGLPSACWFQDIIRDVLHLDPARIGIVPGEYGSEEEVRGTHW